MEKTNSWGVAIGYIGKKTFKLLKNNNDENARLLILDSMIDDCVFILINLYNPNTEKEQVSKWEKMNLMLQIFDDLGNKIIIPGDDLNLFLDSALDAEEGKLILKSSFVSNLSEIKGKYNLCDIWRVRNAKEKHFPFMQKHSSGFLQR